MKFLLSLNLALFATSAFAQLGGAPTDQPFTAPLGYGTALTIVGNGVGASAANVGNALVLRDANGKIATGQHTIVPISAATVGLAVSAVAAQTANLVDVSSAAATSPTYSVTAKGHVLFKRLTKALIDAEVPDAIGAAIICTDCAIPYSLCTATGTLAAQWARAGSATVGCGTNN